MIPQLRTLILSSDQAVRNQSLDGFRRGSLDDLLRECADLEAFRHDCDNLYQRVRALFFLYAIHRFYLPEHADLPTRGRIPFAGHERHLSRRFDEAIKLFLQRQQEDGPNDAISSALAESYHALAFQTLANQVRRSVRGVRGNQWMFRIGHPADYPLRLRPELLSRQGNGAFPILCERTPVRMDLSHSGWSDIFFLGMDYPEGAKVLNISINLGVRDRDSGPRPPIEVYLRVIDEPVIRLVSVDLGATADLTALSEVFDFARDYLGLLKAAIIASGLVPPGLEGSEESLSDLLTRLIGPGLGLEIVSSVNNIPKGSRLAVSTNLLAALIAAGMRATGQARSLTGVLEERERRLVAARAILGEWLGGSGGGWQDSGGVWPGIKLIQGAAAVDGDIEFGVSRGCLLPQHTILGLEEVPAEARQALEDSLVLVHGGMAQNVGPILEMVTEKYLLRSPLEWQARQQALGLFDEIVSALKRGDIRALGAATTRNFQQPIQTIVPWATNFYTEMLIDKARQQFQSDFWGFWMLGGMSGGGMGFIVAPQRKAEAQEYLRNTMQTARRDLQHSLPFALDPVVYDFAINPNGTASELLDGQDALMPPGYYVLQTPGWLRMAPKDITPLQREEMERLGAACRTKPELSGMIETLFDRILPHQGTDRADQVELEALLKTNGFDAEQHERIRADLRRGRIGLAQNRLDPNLMIEDVGADEVIDTTSGMDDKFAQLGRESLQAGEIAVVSLAAGAGSRWTQGAGTVKALHPFCRLGGKHRTFIEVHLAKSRAASQRCGVPLPHIITTGYLTHKPLERYLESVNNHAYPGPVCLSPGKAVGLRLIPMTRDLRFAWEETAQQQLDEQAQKVRDSLHQALLGWAREAGEGADYTDNVPLQCLHPVGHWFEVPNLLRNGTLQKLLADRPQLRHLLVHNIDTVGATVNESLLGLHVASGQCLNYEVIARRIDDRGGGLARVDGKPRLVEGLAMPREEDEFDLSYYNTLSTWVDIDRLLEVFGLSRTDLSNSSRVHAAVARQAGRMPTYVTLKEVKKRWGHGQEDVFPVCQFEKLWGDMTALSGVDCGFFVVSRLRGQQLKDPAQLDGWLRDGSASYVESLCAWD